MFSRSKGSTVFCNFELHAHRRENVLEIWLNPGLYLTIFRGAGPRVLNALPRLSKKRIYPSWPLGTNLRSIMRSNYFLPEVEGFCW